MWIFRDVLQQVGHDNQATPFRGIEVPVQRDGPNHLEDEGDGARLQSRQPFNSSLHRLAEFDLEPHADLSRVLTKWGSRALVARIAQGDFRGRPDQIAFVQNEDTPPLCSAKLARKALTSSVTVLTWLGLKASVASIRVAFADSYRLGDRGSWNLILVWVR